MIYKDLQTLAKPGDWLIFVAGFMLVCASYLTLWSNQAADKAIVRSGGQLFAELNLSHDQTIPVPGPLGVTLVTVVHRQARIAQDPSPRQYCVKQGWLKKAGEVAVCLPNQVSLELAGSAKRYDSLSY